VTNAKEQVGHSDIGSHSAKSSAELWNWCGERKIPVSCGQTL